MIILGALGLSTLPKQTFQKLEMKVNIYGEQIATRSKKLCTSDCDI
jgi:hypothetical protein